MYIIGNSHYHIMYNKGIVFTLDVHRTKNKWTHFNVFVYWTFSHSQNVPKRKLHGSCIYEPNVPT